MDIDQDYAFRITYADESALEIYADGRALIVPGKDRVPYPVPARIINRIPQLIAMAQANVDCEPR